jgi:hypothetical protein
MYELFDDPHWGLDPYDGWDDSIPNSFYDRPPVVNEDGIGFIRRTKEWLALQKAREEAPVCACEFKFSLSQERCLRLAELEGDSNP